MSFTIGSLFDGSGGFPLAAFLCGGTPLWASEVEPYPIAVTKTRFPHMKHLGSVTEVKGDEVEPVDVITFGSPCQDLSIAGKRAGLKHEGNGDEETTRSGLFMEAVRIIKEMREATNGVYPRFALWENVPGAFSSNRGEDFRIVLEELIKIVEPTAVMPPVPKAGWPYADHYCGDGWSLAYRVFDAQYWGVPQRRRRIYLVLDLGGQCAGKVSFERDGLRGHFTEGGTPWESLAGDAESGTGTADCEADSVVPYTLKIRSGCEGGGKGALIQTDMSATLSTLNDQYLFQPVAFTQNQRDELRDLGDKAGSLQAEPGMHQQTFVVQPILDDQGGSQISVRYDGKCPTLRAEAHGNVPCVLESAGFCPEQSAKTRGIGYEEEESPTLRAGVTPAVVYSIENHPADSRVDIDVTGTVQTLTGRMGTGGGNVPMVMESSVIWCIDGDKIGKAERAGGSGLGIRGGDKMYTLTAKDAGTHAVCYGIGNGQANQSYSEEVVGALNCMHDQQAVAMPIVFDKEVYQSGQNATGGHYIAEGGPAPTLRTTGSPPGVAIQYIVRRRTPTECARLQGFADGWGHPDHKDDFTDEEYRFWLNVRNTHAEINGKAVKPYTKNQMVKWYNKLHTDSSEYKLWGNGIALPTALYVMQGIAEVFSNERG